MPLSRFQCTLPLIDESGGKSLIKRNTSDFWHSPLRMDFEAPLKSKERKLFLELINNSETDLQFHCHIESNVGKLTKTHTLKISPEQLELLKKKLFGKGGIKGSNDVYVTRNQMLALAHEMYSTMNILTDYAIPENEFSEAFINDLILQRACSNFGQVPVDAALASLSQYGFNIDANIELDIIKSQAESILKVEQINNKSRIILDETKYREFTSSRGDGLGSKWFSVSVQWADGNSQSRVSDVRSLNDQLRELNEASQNEAKWEIEGDNVISKRLNVARLSKSRLKNALIFNGIRVKTLEAPFQRELTLYTRRSTKSVSLEESEDKLRMMYQNFSSSYRRTEKSLQLISRQVLTMVANFEERASNTSTTLAKVLAAIEATVLNTSKILAKALTDIEDTKSIERTAHQREVSTGPPTVFPSLLDSTTTPISITTGRRHDFEYLPEFGGWVKLISRLQTWNQANRYCRNTFPEAQLVTITTESKQQALEKYLQRQLSKDEYSMCIQSDWPHFWMGGQTLDPSNCSSPFFWKTIKTGNTPFEYTNWQAGEPNCVTTNENCASILPKMNYTWFDSVCHYKYCSVCEM